MVIRPRSGLNNILTSLLLDGHGFPHQSSGLFRPSEASVTIQTPYGPKTLGHCPRATWYRLKKVPQSNVTRTPHSIQRMDIGKAVEDDFAEKAKIAGIFIDRNVPFRADFEGIPIAGEMDVICRTEPCSGTNYVTECKSIYSYYAQKQIFGRALNLSREPGAPRDSYLMQTSLYLRKFSTLPENDPSFLPFGAIYICDRGDGHFGTFDTWLSKETQYINDDEQVESHKIYYASDHLDVPVTEVPYSVEDILSNFRQVALCLKNDTPPPRAFVKEYNAEQVEQKYEAGDISASAYKKWKSSHGPRGKKKEKLGDWHCGGLYCKWSDYCWSQEE